MSPLVLRLDVKILFGSFPSVNIVEYIAVYIVGKVEKDLNAINEVAVTGECLSHTFQT